MSKFTFTDPETGKKFAVNAPPGTTEEQAQAIFKQQLDSGSLAGFDVGAALSAATQAVKGLASAQAMVGQTLGALSGKLPVGAALNTITNTLGPGGIGGATQLASSLQGAGASLATNFIGGSVNAAADLVRNASSSLSTATAALQSAVPAAIAGAQANLPGLASALTGAAASAGSLATTAIKNLTSGLSGPITNGINTADLVKQGSLPGLPDLSAINVQAAVSQAAKLVGQPHTVISNALGVGKFGLDATQLETAGLLKPGIAAAAAAAGSSLTSVLQSPLAFTGKDGIKSVDQLLANEGLQNSIQTNLMGEGLSALKSAGIPVNAMNPQAIAGLANNAAKSVANTLDSLKGIAAPDIKSEFDSVVKDSAFAVTLADTKVDPAVLGEVTAEPAENTVNTETLNAAAKRIVGNPKVPNLLALVKA